MRRRRGYQSSQKNMKEEAQEIIVVRDVTSPTMLAPKKCSFEPGIKATSAVDAVRRALEPSGVDVTAVCLGW